MNTFLKNEQGYAKLAIAAVIAIVIIFASLALTSGRKAVEDSNGNGAYVANPIVTQSAQAFNIKEVELVPGVTAEVSGLSITFNELIQDNRCQAGAQCIEAGAVTVSITLETEGKKIIQNISSDEVPHIFEGRAVSIVKIGPENKITFKID